VLEVVAPSAHKVLDSWATSEGVAEVDGTANEGRLGANAVVSASMAVTRWRAGGTGQPPHEEERS
jgi:enolase